MKRFYFKALILALITMVGRSEAQEIRTYFNQRPKITYTEPYRKITRNGDNLEQVLINLVNSARKSVYIAVQEFRLPLLADALIAKRKEGVDVRIVLEHDYNNTIPEQTDNTSGNNESQYEASKIAELRAFVDINKNDKLEVDELLKRDAIYKLRQAKLEVIDDTANGSRGSALMHHKFVLVDDRVVAVGSANFTTSCIHGDITNPESRGNPNSIVVINSTEVAKAFNDEFSQMWSFKNFGQGKEYRGPMTFQVGKSKVSVQFSPTPAKYGWSASVNGLISRTLAEASRSINGALFVFSDQRISDEIEKAHDLGVGISFLIEPKFAYRDYSELLDMLGVEIRNAKCEFELGNNPWKNPALESGMALLPKGDVLHHKFAVVDNQTVVVGSQNWSDSANSSNDETLIVVHSENVARDFTDEYSRVRRSSLLGINERLNAEIKSKENDCSKPITEF